MYSDWETDVGNYKHRNGYFFRTSEQENRFKMISFVDKKILVVGASSGIGAETARKLAESGAKVVLVARREEMLRQICSLIGENSAYYYVADVTDHEKIENLVDRIVSDIGKLDGMVYSAGIVEDVPLRFLTHEKLLKTFEVNYFSFVEFVRQVSKKKNYNPGMRILAISSVSSLMGEKAHSSYCASKAAIDATIRCLAKELWDKGIALNSVQPGMIRTRLYDEFVEKTGDEGSANEALKKNQYAGIGEPSDVANAIAFLLSEESRYITGTALLMDGGTFTASSS